MTSPPRWLRRTLAAAGIFVGFAAAALAASGIELWDATAGKYIGWYIDDATNAALVKIVGGAAAIGSVTQGAAPWSENITQFGGNAVATGTGAGGAGVPRVTVSNDSTVGLVAGAAIVGKVGIDQTTDVTTNGVEIAPTAGSAAGITPVVSAAAEGTHVLKASAGNLYSLYVTTGATGGYAMTFNATSAPGDGAVTPIDCVQVPPNSTAAITNGSGPPDVYSTGISAAFSTTGCFTKTVSATAFFKGRVK